jgi:hypothetical protein
MKTYTEEEWNESYENELEDVLCQMCLKRGYRVLLGKKILMPNEPRPSDYDDWLMCPTCYWLCPIYEVPKEETVTNVIDTRQPI